jgi:DNA (cytosine-5)-methyltransferase 1
MGPPITYGSLFSGVGGFDLGCDAAGWQCQWQVEWDAACRSILERHWPNARRYSDVRDVRAMDVSLAGHANHGETRDGTYAHDAESTSSILGAVDVVTFGFPCQDLSVAGRHAGLDGERSGLFFDAVRIINEMRGATHGRYPRVALAENVAGLLAADNGTAMARCIDALANIGALAIEWRVLDARWFGVPQRRRRVFLVAIFDPRAASCGSVFTEPRSMPRHLATSSQTRAHVASALTRGLGSGGPDAAHAAAGWLTPAELGINEHTGQVHLAASLAMPNPPEITGTVTTTWAKGAGNTQVEEGHVQATPAGVRRLTPRECERLMGWPDDHTRYAADGTEIADTRRYRMCGNGVVAPVARYIAANITRVLNPES